MSDYRAEILIETHSHIEALELLQGIFQDIMDIPESNQTGKNIKFERSMNRRGKGKNGIVVSGDTYDDVKALVVKANNKIQNHIATTPSPKPFNYIHLVEKRVE